MNHRNAMPAKGARAQREQHRVLERRITEPRTSLAWRGGERDPDDEQGDPQQD